MRKTVNFLSAESIIDPSLLSLCRIRLPPQPIGRQVSDLHCVLQVLCRHILYWRMFRQGVRNQHQFCIQLPWISIRSLLDIWFEGRHPISGSSHPIQFVQHTASDHMTPGSVITAWISDKSRYSFRTPSVCHAIHPNWHCTFVCKC